MDAGTTTAIATMSATCKIGTGAMGITDIGLCAKAHRDVAWGEVESE
jgi:hypothetical protein